jgi:hypothetical protein
VTRIVSFADSFTSASAPVISGANQENYVLLNNQAVTNIVGLLFDSSIYKSVFFNYEVERIGSATYRQVGSFIAAFNGTWSLSFGNYQGDQIIDDSLVVPQNITLSINASTGQVSYSSGNQPGHTSSKIKLYIVKVSA